MSNKEPRQRTLKQNRALHKFFEYMAKELSDAGLDIRRTLKPGIEIPWNKDSVKEYLFRPVMKAQVGKDSTASLTTKELNQVSETLIRHLGQRFGIELEFPNIEELQKKNSI